MRLFCFLAVLLLPVTALAGTVLVTVTRKGYEVRPTDLVRVPWDVLAGALPGVEPDKLVVRSADGTELPYQFTNFHPEDRGGRYDSILFPHAFGAGERTATFRVETAPTPRPPIAPLVFARHVPERLDDFAWENNRIAHRIYGAGLATEAAGRGRMISSGVDVWCKRVAYPVIDRWYLRGHDAYHRDNGEGLDFYSVGTTRGAGGTAVWVNGRLSVSSNWSKVRVLANGPLRAVFEVEYGEWQASPTLWVREKRRYTVDVDRNLHRIESTFVLSGAESATVALGLGKHASAKAAVLGAGEEGKLVLWEEYPKPEEGSLGTAVGLLPRKGVEIAEDELNHLLLIPIRSGESLIYFAGAGWSRSGQFENQSSWKSYVESVLAAEADPLNVEVVHEAP
ncbi:MAG: DUF4861 family protein [Opitutaceae bacterium]|nr:DUF4861 family protein [Opitutaceae bacterium]